MDTLLIAIIVVAVVCFLLLGIALTCHWHKQHTYWLRREATKHSTRLLAQRLVALNDKIEKQLADVFVTTLPDVAYDPQRLMAAVLEGVVSFKGDGGSGDGRSDQDGDQPSPVGGGTLPPLSPANATRPKRRSSGSPTINSSSSSSSTSPAETLQMLITAAVRRAVIAKIHSSPLRSRAGGGGAGGGLPPLHLLHDPPPLTLPTINTLELLTNLDTCPEIHNTCRIAIANTYGTVGRIVQIEGIRLFDDVTVMKLASDTTTDLSVMKAEEIESATPHPTCCCLPLCCTSRGSDRKRFRKQRTLFFMNVSTRFCSACNMLEPDEDTADRMEADKLLMRNRRSHRYGNTANNGNGQHGGRRRRGFGGESRLGDDDDYSDNEGDRNGTDNSSRPLSSLASPTCPHHDTTIPTAIDTPDILWDLEEGCHKGKLLNMGDPIARRFIKVSSYAAKTNKVLVNKYPSRAQGTSINSVPTTVAGGGQHGGGGYNSNGDAGVFVPANGGELGANFEGLTSSGHIAVPIPQRTRQQLENEEEVVHMSGPHTRRVIVTPHPDLIDEEDTKKVVEALTIKRRHVVDERLLVPTTTTSTVGCSNTPTMGKLRNGGSGRGRPVVVANFQTSHAYPNDTDASHIRTKVIKELATTYKARGLPLVSRAIDDELFACDGVRDDLIIFFTNLKRLAMTIGLNGNSYNGMGKGAIDPSLRVMLPMYEGIERFDYFCKRWLLHVTLIVSSEAVRAYRIITTVRVREMSQVAVERASERLAVRVANGMPLAPITPTVSPDGSPSDDGRRKQMMNDTRLMAAEALSETLRPTDASPTPALSPEGGEEAAEPQPPMITVRRPRIAKAQQRLLRRVFTILDSARGIFVEAGIGPKGGGLGGGGGSNNRIVLPLLDVCRSDTSTVGVKLRTLCEAALDVVSVAASSAQTDKQKPMGSNRSISSDGPNAAAVESIIRHIADPTNKHSQTLSHFLSSMGGLRLRSWEGVPPAAGTSIKGGQEEEHDGIVATPLSTTEALLRAAVIDPSLVTECAADDDSRTEARRALLTLREELVRRLLPIAPDPQEKSYSDSDADLATEGHAAGRYSNRHTPTMQAHGGMNAGGGRSPQRTNNSRRQHHLLLDEDTNQNNNEEEELAFLVSPEGVGASAQAGGTSAESDTPHSPAHPILDRPLKETVCAYYQILVSAVRQAVQPTEALVAGTVTTAETELTCMLLANFAPNGYRAIGEWEQLLSMVGLPIVRRVAVRLYLYQKVAVLAIHCNTLQHHLQNGTLAGCAEVLQQLSQQQRATTTNTRANTTTDFSANATTAALRALLIRRTQQLHDTLGLLDKYAALEASVDSNTTGGGLAGRVLDFGFGDGNTTNGNSNNKDASVTSIPTYTLASVRKAFAEAVPLMGTAADGDATTTTSSTAHNDASPLDALITNPDHYYIPVAIGETNTINNTLISHSSNNTTTKSAHKKRHGVSRDDADAATPPPQPSGGEGLTTTNFAITNINPAITADTVRPAVAALCSELAPLLEAARYLNMDEVNRTLQNSRQLAGM